MAARQASSLLHCPEIRVKIAVRTARALLLLAGAVASALLIGFVALLLWPLPDMPADGLQGDFLIQNVGVVDVRNGCLLLEGLFFNGKFYDRSALDRLLDFAANRAGSIHTNVHLLWAVMTSPLMRVQLAD